MAIMDFGSFNAASVSGSDAQSRRRLEASATCAPGREDCFHLTLVQGTIVATGRGDIPVETIAPEDILLTRKPDGQPVKAVTIRTLSRETLITVHRLTPVLVRAGAQKTGMPDTDLCLHPWTRLYTDVVAGGTAALRVMELVGNGKVTRIFPDGVTYVELSLTAPAEVMVSGIWLASTKGGALMSPNDMAGDSKARGWCRIGDVTPDWTPGADGVTA